MTRLKSFLAVLLMAVAFSAVAQDYDFSFTNNARYNAKSNRLVQNVKSSCNQGSEPFYKFLKKFKSSESFRKSRCKVSDNFIADVDCFCENFTEEFKPHKLKRKKLQEDCYLETTASFYNVSKNVVCFFLTGENCESGGSSYYRFKRINGKWYLTDLFGAG